MQGQERLRLFVSYSHQDKDRCAELGKYLEQLQDANLIEPWTDGQILAGDNWDDEILNNLRQADIILLLISIDFLRSKYIKSKELVVAKERHAKGEAVIVPVVLRKCQWQGVHYALGQYQALPKGGKPIYATSIQHEIEEALDQVVEGIEKTAKQILRNRSVGNPKPSQGEVAESVNGNKDFIAAQAASTFTPAETPLVKPDNTSTSPLAAGASNQVASGFVQSDSINASPLAAATYVQPAISSPQPDSISPNPASTFAKPGISANGADVAVKGASVTVTGANETTTAAEFQYPEFSALPVQPLPVQTARLLQVGASGGKPSWRPERFSLQVPAYRECLAEGVELTMVQIPAGSFQMGSPEDEPERLASEGPQHLVSLPSFFMAQTPITQAQWAEVASWRRVGRDLKPEPARFKGPNRPVEKVSWLDAQEFCLRLNERFNKRLGDGFSYGLPSEAQWEYACRAGSTTPFHFGATLTPELANYDGNYTYADGPKGPYREKTTEVAIFPANQWGLNDMHGNVWEWCADHWHDSYNFALGDHLPWWIPAAPGDHPRLLRGGAWNFPPGYCRSASRTRHQPDIVTYLGVGLRVVCLPQGCSS
jgi:formylglycine-generating enzyme required for sulfatase activity